MPDDGAHIGAWASAGVSVVVPHYGPTALAEAVVRQLGAQETAREIQVIVSDDASPEPFPSGLGWVVVRGAQNGGFAAAVNRGAAVAEQPLLVILNSDLEIGSTFIEDLVGAASPWLPDALCGVRLEEPDGMETGPRRAPRHTHYLVEWLGCLARWRNTSVWRRLTGTAPVDLHTPGAVVDWVIGAVMLVPTSAYRAVGGMDEQFHMYMEEVDLQRRLAGLGVRSVYLGGVAVRHRKAGSVPSSHARIRAVVHARLLYECKWRGPAAAVRLQAALTAITMVNLVVDTVRRGYGVPVKPLEQCGGQLRAIWVRPMPFRRVLS